MKVGVIGVGSMGQNHARIYSEIADLVGVFDLDAKGGEAIAKRFDTEYHSDMSELLSKVDAVSIATPTCVHHKVAMEAIEAGVDILVEKPFTGDPGTAEEVCAAAEREDVTLAVGLVERFNPVVSAGHDSLAAGNFGDLISISTRRVSSFPARIRDVGVVMDLGIHDVDVIRHVTSSEVRSVYARGGRSQHPSYEDHAEVLMELDGGGVGFLEVNWLTPMKVRRVSMTCSESFVQLDYMDQSMEVSSSSFGELDAANLADVPLEYNVRRVALKRQEPLMLELRDFLDAASKGREPKVTGRDALNDIRVCKAILGSISSGGRVELNL